MYNSNSHTHEYLNLKNQNTSGIVRIHKNIYIYGKCEDMRTIVQQIQRKLIETRIRRAS